jgi:uncharacterized protein YeaO (DUF488 family)
MCRFVGCTTRQSSTTANGCSWTGSGREGSARSGPDWCKEIAPSTELRQWYGHDPDRYGEFARRYRAELDDPERAAAFVHLRELAGQGRLTLLTATKRSDISEAAVLADLLAMR